MKLQIIGLLILAAVAGGLWYWYDTTTAEPDWVEEFMATYEEYHVHADFLVVVNGETLDFTKPEYQSTAEDIKHPGVHLHDQQGDIIHHHAPDITLGTFFSSIDYELTDTCLVTPAGESFCTTTDRSLVLYVNDEPRDTIADYVAADDDRVLLYYGDPTDPSISDYLAAVDDRACIYSGTCPERGEAPPEECGLNCEL